MTMARKLLVDVSVMRSDHFISRCGRNVFLCGEGCEHPKPWLEDRLELLAANFAMSVCGFSLMDNHLHVLVRLDPGVADGWSDEEALLATCVYIGLNPVAAGIAAVPESSPHTSIRQRVRHAKEKGKLDSMKAAARGLHEPLGA